MGKVLDSGTPAAAFNPIVRNSEAFVYSNIFAVLAVLVIAMAVLYDLQFGRLEKRAKDGMK